MDESTGTGPTPATQRWLGMVVPKRWAKRAVTRSLMKRQIREAVSRELRLPAGLWVVRLRSGFDRSTYPSAASEALRQAVRTELLGLMAAAAQRSVRRAAAEAR